MYKNHFKLERRLFRGNAAGPDVFVGPQTATIMSGIKKAVAGSDGIISVSGPVGSGKSTTVAHSLAALSGKNAIVRVGRYPLQRGEVLDLLFDHMQIKQRPQRSNLKLSLFRQLLFNLAQNDAKMFILVEDAPFLGPEILTELEVMTAADTGPSDGANVMLMGDESLREFLAFKSLARLRQRVRFRGKLEPCTGDELRGYLTHSLRRAGGDFGKLFAEGAAGVLHELTGGILRVVNNLVEAVLETAAEAGATKVDLDLISRVANEEFGLTGSFASPPTMPGNTPEPRHTDESTAELLALSMPESDPSETSPAQSEPVQTEAEKTEAPVADPVAQAIADAVADIESDSAQAPAPGTGRAEPATEPAPAQQTSTEETREPVEDDIPELIQDTQPGLAVLDNGEKADPIPDLIHDTLPNLSILSPELAEQAEALESIDADPESGPVPEIPADRPAAKPAIDILTVAPTTDKSPLSKGSAAEIAAKPATDIPTAAPTTDKSPLSKGSAKETPAWDRDPTFAELRPDLEALDRAMAVAQGRDPDAPEEEVPLPVVPEPEAKAEEEPAGVPEITLDDSINRKVDRATLDRRKRQEEETGVIDESEPPGADAEPDAHRQEQANAELEKIAVGLAKAKTLEDVDDKMAETLFGEELSIAAAEVARKVAEEAAAEEPSQPETESVQPAANDGRSHGEKEVENAWGKTPDAEVSIESQFDNQGAGLDVTASQRLATVRALNAENTPAPSPPTVPAGEPVSIEEQFTTTMTQTLEALKVQPSPAPLNDCDDDDDEEEKSGFFSRFRRS